MQKKNKSFEYFNNLVNKYVYIGLTLAINFVEKKIYTRKSSFKSSQLVGFFANINILKKLKNNINMFNFKIFREVPFSKKDNNILFFQHQIN